MSFLIFNVETINGTKYYTNSKQHFKLAGYKNQNLLYNLWCKPTGCEPKPINKGWSVNKDDLIRIYSPEQKDIAFCIDYHPNSKDRIGIVEIDKIHLFTIGEDENADNISNTKVDWVPMMLELKTVLYLNNLKGTLTTEEKDIHLSKIKIEQQKRVIEFLYLKGETWNWGKNGMTNASFIEEKPREYFKKFF